MNRNSLVASFILVSIAGCYFIDDLPRNNPYDPKSTFDFDGDGVPDNEDTFPGDKNEKKDTDKDGVGDNRDNCPAIANPDQADLDNDEVGDVCDPCVDVDHDGYGVGLECIAPDCDDSTSAKTVIQCNDGIECITEQCDEGSANSNEPDVICRPDCLLQRCGDGVQDTGEQCDEGSENSEQPDAVCRTNCLPQRCGDGVQDTGEDCDDGGNASHDGCSALCVNEPADRFGNFCIASEKDACNVCNHSNQQCPHGCESVAGVCWAECNPMDSCCETNGYFGHLCVLDLGEGTIYHPGANLVWMKCSQGQTFEPPGTCSGTSGHYQYCATNDNSCNGNVAGGILDGNGNSQAYETCDNLNSHPPGGYAGNTGWRVPTKDELSDLWEVYDQHRDFFSVSTDGAYWSSSSHESDDRFVYNVNFGDGEVGYFDKTYANLVRCVRSGP